MAVRVWLKGVPAVIGSRTAGLITIDEAGGSMIIVTLTVLPSVSENSKTSPTVLIPLWL